MDQQVLQALETGLFPIFDANPVLMSAAAVPALYDAAAAHNITHADVDKIRADYIAQHDALAKLTAALAACAPEPAPAPAPAPAVTPTDDDIRAAIKQGDHFGLFDEVFATDLRGNALRAMNPANDPRGNVRAAVVAGMLDKNFTVRDALIRDDRGYLAQVLLVDPLGRLIESVEPLNLAGIDDPSQMDSPGRLGEVARANGYKLNLPAQYAIDVQL